jgi:hypothetical protein
MVARVNADTHENIESNDIVQLREIETVLEDPPRQEDTASCSDGEKKPIYGANLGRDGKPPAMIARRQPARMCFV